MGIFATTNILQENFNSTSIIPMNNYNESYFSLSLEYCKMINEEFDNANKTFYKCLLEAGDNYEVINESFDNFFSKIKEIVTKFIKFLKNLIDKFSTKLHQLVKSDKYITKNEKLINTFSSDNEFDMKIFNFTFLDDINIPMANAYTTFENEFNAIKLLVDGGNDSITKIEPDKQITTLRDHYTNMLDKLEDEYDTFRGAVINEKPIDSSDFASELYRKFRDGDDTASTTTITSSVVTGCLLRFKNYDKSVKSIKEIQKKLDKDYSNISKHVEKIVSGKADDKLSLIGWNGTSDFTVAEKLSGEVITELNTIAKAQSNKVQVLSNIHLQAIGAKLDAINACYKQDKTILYKVITELQKWKNVKEDVAPTVLDFDRNNILEVTSSYNTFMTLESYNQRKMDNYITECLAIESKNSDVLHYITEGALDTIKEFIQKIITKFREFFGKVSESISKTFKSDQEYLKKYKDIILNKKVQLGNISDYYEINTKELVSGTPIPEFNYEMLKSHNLDTEEALIDYDNSFKKAKIKMKDKQNFGEAAKEYFMGDPKEIDSEKINMTNLYNFCWSADETIKIFQKEQDKLLSAQANAIKIADKYNRSSSNNSTSSSSNESPKTDLSGTENSQTATDSQNESYVFSSVYNNYINESVLLELSINGKDKNTSSSSSNSSSSTTNSAPSTTNNMSKNVNAVQGRKDENLSKSIDGDNPDLVSKRITAYFNVSNAFLMAKIAALQKGYDDYMEIIRAHVRSYAGDKDAKNKDYVAQSASVSFEAPDAVIQTLNQDQVQEYNEKKKAAKDSWKTYYGTYNGAEFYNMDGKLPNNAHRMPEDETEKAKIISDLRKAYIGNKDKGGAWKEYWDKMFKDYPFPFDVEDSEYTDDEASRQMKKDPKNN